jgi:hypothetical protein
MKAYIGTFDKYSAGSLVGGWLDLADFAGDMDLFLEAARALHPDEADPELMIQDYDYSDNPPKCILGESITQAALDYAALAWDERELVSAWIDITGGRRPLDIAEELESARDAFRGVYRDEEEAAREIVIEYLEVDMQKIPDWLVIDYEASWRCSVRHDYTAAESGGQFWVFSIY